ncbi:MAG TPA: LuxR C-terminal-related transcriptional regulator [Steroidobacteraceae bacterium]
MSDIRQITDWRAPTSMGAAYERLLSSIGTEEFGSTVRDSVMSVTAGARRIYLFEATGRQETTLQYFFGEPGLADLFPAYLKSYLRLDPVGEAYRAAPACSNVALQRVYPTDIASPGFRRRIFDDAGIIERVSVIQRGPDSWRAMNVARHASDGCFSDTELGSLVSLACLLLPMLPLNRKRGSGRLTLSVAQLEERFASRYGSLTQRERQVCARAALGMSVEATALDLGIGKTSVLTYRQRAYLRLKVTSPFELCALVTH